MSAPAKPEQTRLQQLQLRISLVTWAVTFLLSLRGMYDFYGMKQRDSIEQVVHFSTEPVVQLFQFKFLENLDIPGITVFFATISLLLASYTIRFFLHTTENRYAKTRALVAQHVISTTAK